MFLRKQEHLVVEEGPVAGFLADSDNGDQETGCGGEIGGLWREEPWVSIG
jgi:hypothetical protein